MKWKNTRLIVTLSITWLVGAVLIATIGCGNGMVGTVVSSLEPSEEASTDTVLPPPPTSTPVPTLSPTPARIAAVEEANSVPAVENPGHDDTAPQWGIILIAATVIAGLAALLLIRYRLGKQ